MRAESSLTTAADSVIPANPRPATTTTHSPSSQLFRNVVFASEMANGADWLVVNLMSKTQRRLGQKTDKYSFDDPEPHVRSAQRLPGPISFQDLGGTLRNSSQKHPGARSACRVHWDK